MKSNSHQDTVLVVLGSARNDGHTFQAVSKLLPFKVDELIDLNNYKIVPYQYDHTVLQGDDFLKVANKMLSASTIVFATPVYWYSMSGQMKVFFDRLTELLSTHKPIGKALKGRKTYLVSTGGNPTLPDGFEVPFKDTSEYFDMEYMGAFYEQRK